MAPTVGCTSLELLREAEGSMRFSLASTSSFFSGSSEDSCGVSTIGVGLAEDESVALGLGRFEV